MIKEKKESQKSESCLMISLRVSYFILFIESLVTIIEMGKMCSNYTIMAIIVL